MGQVIIILGRVFATLSASLVVAGLLVAVMIEKLIMIDMPIT